MRVKVTMKRSLRTFEGELDGHNNGEISLYCMDETFSVMIPWNEVKEIDLLSLGPLDGLIY